LRSGTRFLVIAIITGLALTAQAEDFSSCWVAQQTDRFGFTQQVTRCRISGGDVVDYASDTSVPSRLYPNLGTDLTGECWYLTSAVTRWVYLSLFVNGDAILGFDPDPAPGSVALATERIPRCTSEPNPLLDPTTEAWQYVTQYIHAPPTPSVNPVPGDGVTGLETFVGVPVPEVHETQLASATGVTLDIYIEVSGVEIDWGDDRVDSFPADPAALAGYPDGLATHIYEVKHEAGYGLSISYDWTARWRVAGGEWEFLAVPSTTTIVDYPVAEIVSVITE
jgi:hypothetical protein